MQGPSPLVQRPEVPVQKDRDPTFFQAAVLPALSPHGEYQAVARGEVPQKIRLHLL